MVIGPGFVGTPVANAGLFGIGPDIDIFDLFGGDGRKRSEKSNSHHSRPDGLTTVQTQGAKDARAGTGVAPAPTAKVGSVSEGVRTRQFAASSADNVNVPRSANGRGAAVLDDEEGGRGDGGRALPRISVSGRAANLAPVPTAPSTRSVVIRGTRPTAGGSGAPTAVSPQSPVVSSAPQAPVAAPLAAAPPVPEAPEGRPSPAGPPAPSIESPPAKDPGAPIVSGIGRVPDSYRVGYAEYLRSATTGDLLVAALPGVAGIAGFTLIGAYVGYRQARALQQALVTPVPTRIVM
ncbi:hypothetical protein CQY20_25840 [Mycolicibacterium agri]|uniref:Uncharacterized protein n=2 Tax=Mycolicibacterium agri TaxID=36811 RepID=A0A2A7MS79_MYCAG|nr:hypothetical protein CQY20_25840 [Mycolicibacterium agri]GFG49059.1 hypothetical protein MAGR_05000 [Mycolicibacterium agri]